MMKWSICWLGLFVLAQKSTCAPRDESHSKLQPSAIFFVATNGNDQWSGRLPNPSPDKADGPFATLPRGLKAARDTKKQTPSNSGSPQILVRGGIHFLSEPLVLTPIDSWLMVAAYQKETPIVSGGRQLHGWKEESVDGRNLWVAELPQARDRKWIFRELWVNGHRAIRARHPNKGYFNVAELPDKPKEWTQGQTRFRYRAGDLKNTRSLTNGEVLVMSRWVESRLPIVAIDEAQRLISFGKRTVFELDEAAPYSVEGVLEFLDAPGEWYLDSHAGRIYYQPKPGEQLRHIEAIAPALQQIIRIEGRPEEMKYVDNVSFKNLTFTHSEWNFPTAESGKEMEAGGFSQAAIGVPGAVWGEGLRNCTFENCTFSNLGNYGLELGRGCQTNRIVYCNFSELGAGGLKVGETGFRDNPAEQTCANDVSDCDIHDGGKMFPSAIGVWIGQSGQNRLTHNHIHDFYYTGISIGWTWGYGRSLASSNIIEFNHVHHIGIKSDGDGPILSDMGGIYTLGKQPGTRVINNVWHDIAGKNYGGWGIYFDEGSSGILAQSNLVYRTTHGGFHQHYGETNMVWNNIFSFARDQQIQRSRVEPHLSFSFKTNIVYFDNGVLLGNEWKDDHFEMDWNDYFDARQNRMADDLRFGNAALKEWRERGHDQHSIIADPLFVSAPQNDFRLKQNSPALKLGFNPIDLNQVGIRKPPKEKRQE